MQTKRKLHDSQATNIAIVGNKMNVVIIKYNAGNIRSVDFALKRLGVNAQITDSAEKIQGADKVIFPGVGEAGSTMQFLRQTGMNKLLKSLHQPFLGICLGMQLMCHSSEEGDTNCLGMFDENVKRFVPQVHADKVPHMGWNQLENLKGKLFRDIKAGEFVYFVHSFYVPVCDFTAASTQYIVPFSAALEKDNFYATQFHPEKSGSVGETILKNFLEL